MKIEIGDILKMYRTACGFSQQQIAEQLHIDRTTYTYYESNHTQPSIENLIKLARIFNVSVNELMGVPDSSPAIFRDSSGDDDDDSRLNSLVGASRVGELTRQEKKLVLSFRTLTDDQRSDLLLKIACLGSENMTAAAMKNKNKGSE